jgi:hypothetical protein
MMQRETCIKSTLMVASRGDATCIEKTYTVYRCVTYHFTKNINSKEHTSFIASVLELNAIKTQSVDNLQIRK